MNDQADFLNRLIAKLSAAGIPFMLVGSVAASYHGHPRSTDVIHSKPEWSKLGASERQFADALQVARTQGNRLDLASLEKWSKELGVADLWNQIKKMILPYS
jgi:hypothetical protein